MKVMNVCLTIVILWLEGALVFVAVQAWLLGPLVGVVVTVPMAAMAVVGAYGIKVGWS